MGIATQVKSSIAGDLITVKVVGNNTKVIILTLTPPFLIEDSLIKISLIRITVTQTTNGTILLIIMALI